MHWRWKCEIEDDFGKVLGSFSWVNPILPVLVVFGCVTNYRRLGGLSNQRLFAQVWRLGNPEPRCQLMWSPSVWFAEGCFLVVSLHGREWKVISLCLFCKESWAQKNWCFWTTVLEKTLESSLDCKEIQPVHPKGDQSWVFIGRTDVEAETPILWPPDTKSWLIWKDPDAGQDWRREEKGMTEDDMVGWHHWLSGHEFE